MSGVQSIERAFALLRALAVGPAGVTDLADRTDLPKSTVARLLAALATEGAVQRADHGGEYRLGDDLLELAHSTSPDRSLIATARPFLSELTEATGESSGISVLEGGEVRYLDNVDADEEVQIRDWTGVTVPFHLVPSGFVLVAGLPRRDLDRVLDGRPTEGRYGAIEPLDIRSRIDEVRQTGYLWGYGEFDDGINSVAAPVIDQRGDTMAALHVHGPAYRFPEPGRANDIGGLVHDAAVRLALRLT